MKLLLSRVGWGQDPAPAGQDRRGRGIIDGETGLLLHGLLGRLGLVEFARLLFGCGNAEGLLQEAAGLQAVGPGVALGLHDDLALWRDRHLDDAGHHVSLGARVMVGFGPVGAGAWYRRTTGTRK